MVFEGVGQLGDLDVVVLFLLSWLAAIAPTTFGIAIVLLLVAAHSTACPLR